MIERVITPTMVAAAKASPSRLLAFAEINTSSGWVRVHSGHGERVYNGQTYLGMGEFAGIGQFTENADTSNNRVTLSLKVLDPALLAEVMNESLNGYECFVHLVALDEYRRVLEGVDYVIDGEIVDVKVQEGSLEKQIPSVISLVVGDWIERWATPAEAAKTTDADQQHLFPGDRFFDLAEIVAGSPANTLPVKTNYSGSGRGGMGGDPVRRLK
ncbi:hypothetical protein [Ponticaulis sp.]|uniref:hypothetical protein n=1 Tax=Ponticaulis sp. TaxID=2020902 RepID=UPI000C43E244|nr:hypothetical protein [Ponticaulis sp.]MAP22862.1 hypothetical protein [Alteromonadaceae bacterium]MAX41428.1 hypothetical protein [Alteromonadaceae bacterium]MBN05126.1 hypothetical protein [Ponticaulis sp.]HBY41456.1 hypothetical protein [Alteromonas sp.]|tara:strand:- start:9454 stop:10095 length:642 start_codon:yes stop_codon:yes gene_type:complete